MLIAYARTSTVDQAAGFQAQLDALKAAGCEKFFQEQVSALGDRTQLEAMLEFAREGDSIVVQRLDRLARSVADLLSIIKRLEAKSVGLRVLDFGGSAIDTKGPTGKLILTMVGAIGEFERSLMLERQRHGIAEAKARGKYKGREPTARAQTEAVKNMHAARVSAVSIADKLGMSRASVFRILKAHNLTKPRDVRK
jgi:DNA invertase Pin-like site-specific DNA recombinase